MSNVIANTRNSVRVLGLFAIMMAFAAMFAAGPASANGLTPATDQGRVPMGTYLVRVVDAKTQEIVNGAEIEILNASGNVVAKAVVGADAKNPSVQSDAVEFRLPQGNYKMYITAPGYETVNTQISVKAGRTIRSQIALEE